MTPVCVNGGALPCVRLTCETSGDCVTKEPHLSPQHFELNAKQQPTSLGKVTAHERPKFIEMHITRPQPRLQREGGRGGEFVNYSINYGDL